MRTALSLAVAMTMAAGTVAFAQNAPAPAAPALGNAAPANTYNRDEIVNGVSDFMGVTAEAAGGVVEKLFAKNGQPVGYIAGEEGAGAIVVGGRYGRGLLYMKGKEPVEVFWQGPSVGWDFGGNASRVFTLVYDMEDVNQLYQRFPAGEGQLYFVGGFNASYVRRGNVVLIPIRVGAGLRMGVNAGYLKFSKKQTWLPF